MAYNPAPFDTEIDVDPALAAVTWDLSPEVDEIQIFFGTEYPPVNMVQDWTTSLTTSLPVSLDWNLEYFWRINTRNAVVETTVDIWGFTTQIQPPGSFTATAGDYDAGGVDNDVLMEWVSSVVPSRALKGYNIFQNGIQIATEVPGDSYTLYDAPYNMTAPGNEYWAVAVFDEGVSLPSNSAFALVNGLGTFDGVSYEGPATATIVGSVDVHIEGVDPDGGIWVYDLPTDAVTGAYSIDVIAGTYTITGSKFQYDDDVHAGVVLAEGATVTQDLYLDPWGPPACAITPAPADEEQDW